MKTIIQIICCFAVCGLFFAFYCMGGSEEQKTTADFDAYHQKGVQTNPTNFENMWIEGDPHTENLNGYTKYKYRYTYTMNVTGQVDKATLKVPIPRNQQGNQYISNLKLTPKPYKIFEVNGNSIAEYKLTNLKEGKYNFVIDGIANVRRYDIKKAKEDGKNPYPERDIKRYLIGEKGIETNHQLIRKIASSIPGYTQEEIVENIYQYVKKHIDYSLGQINPSAVNGLRSGRGQCGEFAAAMVAICRARGIPARIVSGNIARSRDTAHTWVEVYYPKYGWVLYDPTLMDGTISATGRRTSFVANNDYISSIRNEFTPWYMTYSNTNTGYNGNITLRETINIIRQ